MITEPKIDNRKEQPYVAIRSQVLMEELPTVIPQQIGEVAAWLGMQGLAPAGAPFIRYNVINMAADFDIEIGWPVASAVSGNGRVSAGVLPAGRYASLLYTGVYPGLPDANGVLLDWAKEKGIELDSWIADNGYRFGARLETYLTDPAVEPDQAKHETEIAMRLADN